MARHTEFIALSPEDKSSLKTLLCAGNSSARKLTRARILDLLSRHTTPPEIARLLGCSPATVYNIKRRYQAAGLATAVTEKPRSGKPPTISGHARAQVTALACSQSPPETR